MLRNGTPVQGTLSDLIQNIPNITITAFSVEHAAPLDGKTLGEFNLRKQHNLLVLAIRRGEAVITGLSGDFQIVGGDIAIVYAAPEDIAKGAVLFKQTEK
jgi:CPA2 family monovalent cation:H+ antiporter-2